MAAKKQTYEQAMKRLEEIVSLRDSNELDIDLSLIHIYIIASAFANSCWKAVG